MFAPLAGLPPLVRLIDTLLDAAIEQSRIVVAVAAPLADDVREFLAGHQLPEVRIAVAAESGSRAECVAAALKLVAGDVVPAHSVLLCDVRQPLTPVELCARVIAALGSAAVVLPVLPLTDSVKVVDARGTVRGTLDRATLRAVQYPRGFAVDILTQLLAQRASDEFDELDETLRAGVPLTAVEGDAEALCADLPRDAQFVEAIIAGGAGHGR
ncbi:IspD/TarI family cytidylyltransferase [Mycobacterium deserti]|uniref:IspD/TarI family cytidylyltransferase n=1 Tax=Mycobacterium deserti TaxID=2978347 RepID=UPI0021B62950|nr:2-C-methyl-D-erythritol 4-phosphate cytidylyltransferase [Mycobacterium deserti]